MGLANIAYHSIVIILLQLLEFFCDRLANSSKNIQISYTHVVRECGNSEKCEGGCFVCLFLCVSNIIHTFAQYWQVISHSSFLSLVGGALGIHGIRFLIFCNSLFFFFFFLCVLKTYHRYF